MRHPACWGGLRGPPAGESQVDRIRAGSLTQTEQDCSQIAKSNNVSKFVMEEDDIRKCHSPAWHDDGGDAKDADAEVRHGKSRSMLKQGKCLQQLVQKAWQDVVNVDLMEHYGSYDPDCKCSWCQSRQAQAQCNSDFDNTKDAEANSKSKSRKRKERRRRLQGGSEGGSC